MFEGLPFFALGLLTRATLKVPQGQDRRAFLQDLRATQAQNTQNEATAFAVLYNNVLFLLAVTLGAFFVFSTASATVNYILSVSVAAACTSLGTATVLAPSSK